MPRAHFCGSQIIPDQLRCFVRPVENPALPATILFVHTATSEIRRLISTPISSGASQRSRVPPYLSMSVRKNFVTQKYLSEIQDKLLTKGLHSLRNQFMGREFQ